MDQLIKAGWVKCRKENINNIMTRKSYALTIEGRIVVELVFSYV
jgi:DNA-binding PadR family transcriptional regulator